MRRLIARVNIVSTMTSFYPRYSCPHVPLLELNFILYYAHYVLEYTRCNSCHICFGLNELNMARFDLFVMHLGRNDLFVKCLKHGRPGRTKCVGLLQAPPDAIG
jgi:hypothetical protein